MPEAAAAHRFADNGRGFCTVCRFAREATQHAEPPLDGGAPAALESVLLPEYVAELREQEHRDQVASAYALGSLTSLMLRGEFVVEDGVVREGRLVVRHRLTQRRYEVVVRALPEEARA